MLDLQASDAASETTSGPNIMPLVDVMLLLLIFFLLASVFARPTLEVDLPDTANSQLQPEQQQQLTFVLDRDGQVFLNKIPIAMTDVQPRITAALTQDPQTPIIVRADKACPFKHFVAVMDAAKGAGATQLVVETTRTRTGEVP
jgi:biopolymer transport protein ExbD